MTAGRRGTPARRPPVPAGPTDDPHEDDSDPPAPVTDDLPGRLPAADRMVMRARLTAMAAPRDTDTPQVAALRAALRDQALMAHVTANVEQWPPLTDEQRGTLAALLGRPRRRAV